MEVEFSLLTTEDAEKDPVGKAREGPSPLDEPKFVSFFSIEQSQCEMLMI